MLDITFAEPSLPAAGALVLPVASGGEGGQAPGQTSGKGQVRSALESEAGPRLRAALEIAEFKGKPGQTVAILAPTESLTRIVAVGLGDAAVLTPLAVEEAAGHATSHLAREERVSFDASALSPEQAAHLALGAALRAYRFDVYRTKEKPEDKPRLARVTVLTNEPDAARAAWEKLGAVARGVTIARDLVTEPPNVLNPAEFARRIEALATLGLDVEVLGPEAMREHNFGALLGVAQGSANEPRTVIMRWNGAGASGGAPVAFIGKGVTFDSGGISIKPAQGMEEMKYDMAGAAAVVGVMAALAARSAPVDAVGLVGLVENMPSGTAQRPGDVVRTHSGQTVELINTDAEGRMVLADVLSYCRERFKPQFMIDLATLTGAIIVALGHEQAGCFCSDETLATRLLEAGAASGDRLWRMPLGEAYDKQLKSDIADMKHVTGRPGSAVTAAHFIKRFVGDTPWAHLDIAGMAWASKDLPLAPKGATGYGVRLLDRLVADYYETAVADR